MHAWPTPQVPQIPGNLTSLRVRDTATDSVEPIIGRDSKVGLYSCGITPYDATHMGHAATYVHIDVLKRALLDAGFTVLHTQNVTDIDDPLLERAQQTGVDWQELARDQVALFAEDMTALGVIPPDTYLGAVETIPEAVAAIQQLIASGDAYVLPAPDATYPGAMDVYADVSRDPAFIKEFSHDDAPLLELFAERGGNPHKAGKRSPLDPILWLAAREGEPSWDGDSLGRGRPGWHIECAVIARRGLGEYFDIQSGGSDLAFPHHPMSTSHSRLLYDGLMPYVNMHTGMVGLDGEKMSKSLGNLVLVSALRESGVDPMAMRLGILAHRYDADWDWTDEVLDAAQHRLTNWVRACSGNGGAPTHTLINALRVAVANDLDTPAALDAMDVWAAQTLAGDDRELGAPGVASRAVNSLLGIRF